MSLSKILFSFEGRIPRSIFWYYLVAYAVLWGIGKLIDTAVAVNTGAGPNGAFGCFTVLIVLLEVLINTSTAHWHPGRTLALGSLLVGAGFGSLALASGAWSVTATVVVWTFGEMILLPGMSTYAADLAPADRRGEYMGYYSMAFGVAFALGPWLGTEVLARFGGAVLWSATLAFGLVSALAMLRLPSPRPEAAAR